MGLTDVNSFELESSILLDRLTKHLSFGSLFIYLNLKSTTTWLFMSPHGGQQILQDAIS